MFGNSLVYSAHSARVPDFIAEKDATFRSFRSDNSNLFPQTFFFAAKICFLRGEIRRRGLRGAVSKFLGSTRAVPFTSPNYHACPTRCWGKNINVNYFVVCLTKSSAIVLPSAVSGKCFTHHVLPSVTIVLRLTCTDRRAQPTFNQNQHAHQRCPKRHTRWPHAGIDR